MDIYELIERYQGHRSAIPFSQSSSESDSSTSSLTEEGAIPFELLENRFSAGCSSLGEGTLGEGTQDEFGFKVLYERSNPISHHSSDSSAKVDQPLPPELFSRTLSSSALSSKSHIPGISLGTDSATEDPIQPPPSTAASIPGPSYSEEIAKKNISYTLLLISMVLALPLLWVWRLSTRRAR